MTAEDDKEIIERLIALLENDSTIAEGIANGNVKVRFGYECVAEVNEDNATSRDVAERAESIIRPYLHIN